MRRWLTLLAALAVIAALVLLRAMVSAPGERAPAEAATAQAAVAPATFTPPATTLPAPAPASPSPAAPAAPRTLDPRSDAFFFRFDEIVPARLTAAAARCYEGARRVHRNQKLTLAFKTHVVAGEVTVSDVTILESTLDYPNLESCFVREVAAVHWHDDALPDWTQDDQLVLRPERGMKKYARDNLDYEGDGPAGPAIMIAGQPAPRSDTATRGGDDDW
jgi:hypothetical protein